MNQDNLKKDIQSYIDLDDEIRSLSNDLKDLKLKKKSIEENILDYMKSSNLDQINLGKGNLKLVKSKTFETLKKDYILDKLSETMDSSKAEEITTKILNNRKSNETTKIQRN